MNMKKPFLDQIKDKKEAIFCKIMIKYKQEIFPDPNNIMNLFK